MKKHLFDEEHFRHRFKQVSRGEVDKDMILDEIDNAIRAEVRRVLERVRMKHGYKGDGNKYHSTWNYCVDESNKKIDQILSEYGEK